jgi:hypothetical protein
MRTASESLALTLRATSARMLGRSMPASRDPSPSRGVGWGVDHLAAFVGRTCGSEGCSSHAAANAGSAGIRRGKAALVTAAFAAWESIEARQGDARDLCGIAQGRKD